MANKMEGIEIGSIVEIDDVLLVGSRKATIVGQPKIPGAKVVCLLFLRRISFYLF